MPPSPQATGVRVVNASQNVLVPVWATVIPESIDEVREAIVRSTGRLSVSGQRYSPDLQFALEGALHIDLSQLSRVVSFWPLDGRIRVQAGARWSEVVRFIQPHGFSLKIAPEFGNFSVGGAVASNLAGLGVGTGPVGNAVVSMRVVLATGEVVDVTPASDPDLFAGLIGGFGGLGVIVEVELQLSRNAPLLRKSVRLDAASYAEQYRTRIESDPGAVLHSGVFYGPRFRKLRATTWVDCDLRPTNDQPLRVAGVDDPLERILPHHRPRNLLSRMWHEHVSDPLRASRRTVHWRNYEAIGNIAQAIPRIHELPSTETLEFVVPPARLALWLERMQAVLAEFHVRASQLSIRHHAACTRSLLTQSTEDAFLLTLLVRTRHADDAFADHAAWVRALIDVTLDCNGTFSLAHRMHATREQVHRAYPGIARLLEVKRRVDPTGRLGNGLWTRYLEAAGDSTREVQMAGASEFRSALSDVHSRDVIHRLIFACSSYGRGARLFSLLQRVAARSFDDELIYRSLHRTLLKWDAAPWGVAVARTSDWRAALQKRLIRTVRARIEAMPWFDGRTIDGVLDVDGTGGQMGLVRRQFRLTGHVGSIEPFGLASTGAAGGGWLATRVPARAMSAETIRERLLHGVPDRSVSLVLLMGGLNGLLPHETEAFLRRLSRVTKPGALVLLVEHDVDSAQGGLEASLALTLAYLCEGAPWEATIAHPRNLMAADEWVSRFAAAGFFECAPRETFQRTPAGNVMLSFRLAPAPADTAGRD